MLSGFSAIFMGFVSWVSSLAFRGGVLVCELLHRQKCGALNLCEFAVQKGTRAEAPNLRFRAL